jgi:NAD(P)-dependent dehydrogenase (short-subunit alcohol dehydrogenase family)
MTMGKLDGRVAIVTGGGRGLGKAFCLGLAAEGARILAATNEPVGLDQAVEEVRQLGTQGESLLVDVTSDADMKKMARYAMDRFGRIDILINNAALYYGLGRKPFHAISTDEWDMVMAVNVKGLWLSTKAVYPYMKEAGKGKIVNLASEVFFTGSHGFAHYVATKGAVVGLTRALAIELGPDNICINAIAPGFTDTEGSRTIADVTKYDTSKTPIRRLGTAEDIVGTAVFLSSDAADFITGQTILVDGGRAMH